MRRWPMVTAAAQAWTPGRRVERFAEGLARRHATGTERRSRTGRVFVRAATAAPRVVHGLARVTGRIELVLARAAHATRRVARRSRDTGVPHAVAHVTRIVRRSDVAQTVARRAGAVAERVVARGGRAERGSAPWSRGVAAAPVARVVRRGAMVGAPASSVPAERAWDVAVAARRPVPSPTVGDAEIARVADRVLQTIDRRVQAHRERHGRV